jgi:hypothetical protein
VTDLIPEGEGGKIHISYLKIDVEGFDIAAIESSLPLLQNRSFGSLHPRTPCIHFHGSRFVHVLHFPGSRFGTCFTSPAHVLARASLPRLTFCARASLPRLTFCARASLPRLTFCARASRKIQFASPLPRVPADDHCSNEEVYRHPGKFQMWLSSLGRRVDGFRPPKMPPRQQRGSRFSEWWTEAGTR